MSHKTHPGVRLSKQIRKTPESAVLLRHAGVKPRGIQRIQISERILAAQKTFQIRGEEAARSGPALANVIELFRAHLRKIKAGADRVVRKGGIVLDTADPFLGYSKKKFAIARNASGRIVHL